uniref:Protein croquemort n=1 Tax=Steinernema glaseri TaxID=37863 RepID=A0A1I7XYQ7_9BILA
MGKSTSPVDDSAPSSGRPAKCTIFFLVIAVLILVLSAFCWFAFEPIFTAMVAMKLTLTEDALGVPSQATFLWAKPPMNNTFSFYIYNVTNPTHVAYYGEKPHVIQVGPFAIRESEQKKEYVFSDGGDTIWYKNYKMFVYQREGSCEECTYDAPVYIPNLPAIGAMMDLGDPKYNVSRTAKWIISLGLIALGEYPFKVVRFGDLVFDGYEDPLLSLGHSPILKYLSDTYNNGSSIMPFPIPPLEKMGFFVGYNNSNDEDYTISSGKANIRNIANIEKWAGMASLPWWKTEEANEILGSDTGSFSPPNLKKTDRLYMFQSYMCRSFYMDFNEEKTVHGIPGYNYEVPHEVYDTTLEQNIGFRYENREKVNYFPQWPTCPPKMNTTNCDLVDVNCGLGENLCHECCDRSYFNGTYLLPPGFFPMACFPGKNQEAPFGMIFSAPHYLLSPKTAVDSVYGLDPHHEAHIPLSYTHEPQSGMVTEVKFRLQINVPVRQWADTVQSGQLPNKFIPVLWADSHTFLAEPAYDMIYNFFVTIPKAVYITKFVSLFIGILVILFVVAVRIRIRQRERRRLREQNALLGAETRRGVLVV